MLYSKERIPTNTLSDENYVSTENMLPNFGGKCRANSLPTNGSAIVYQTGDILLSNIRPYLKKVWLAKNNGGCSTDVFVLKANQEKCNSDYLHYIVASDNFIDYVMSGAKGIKMPRGDKEQIKKYRLSIPTPNEQCKIAALLSKLDTRIETQNKIIQHLESLIKGISKMLLTKQGNTFIKDCLVCNSSTLQESSVLPCGKYPVYGATGISGYLDVPQVEHDAILIIKDGAGVGNVRYATDKHGVIGTLNYLSAKNGYNLKYLYYCLRIFNFTPFVTGLAIPHIYFRDYGNAKIYCPSLIEQKHIANNLSNIERKIEVEKQILEKLKEQKKYLLSQMFI